MGRKPDITISPRFPDSEREEVGEQAAFIRESNLSFCTSVQQLGSPSVTGTSNFKELNKREEQHHVSRTQVSRSDQESCSDFLQENLRTGRGEVRVHFQSQQTPTSQTAKGPVRSKSRKLALDCEVDSDSTKRRQKLPGRRSFVLNKKDYDSVSSDGSSDRQSSRRKLPRGATIHNISAQKPGGASPRKALPRGSTMSDVTLGKSKSGHIASRKSGPMMSTSTKKSARSGILESSSPSARKSLPRSKTFTSSMPTRKTAPDRNGPPKKMPSVSGAKHEFNSSERAGSIYRSRKLEASSPSARKSLPRGRTFTGSMPPRKSVPDRGGAPKTPSVSDAKHQFHVSERASSLSRPRKQIY